ncbi:hypothetical protein E4U09_004248 [Claviceps aff. purpurea]|uniref:3'-5' exonuclease domain-containing protein n=1 Tax=Claviceps aff. purpurea TaxID=1967640 RepID=A0A9P7QPA0_9HYPO|nr:hypothetical protein E4U09_004248 [Claviceps aff. purpurea]
MGKFAFIIANAAGVTLKAVLEASQINKVFFDVRNDSDALFHHFQISLQGVQDIQLMELATRGKNRRLVASLARATKRDSPITFIEKLKTYQPSTVYVDLEGCQLSRNGTISIVTIYATTLATAYIVDVHKLGKSAFTTANTTGTTLKAILESANIKKVIFDVRNDSDALFHHFQISLQGVQDLQLMELAARRKNRRSVAGLAKCIQNDSPISKAEKMKWD